jgi:lysophospholipase L1-like esterase
MTLTGICAIGDSNTHMSYMGLANQCQDCNGLANNYASRWTQKLATASGWRVINHGDNGRKIEDFLGTGAGVLGWSNAELPYGWLNARAKYYICCFGLNDASTKSTAEFEADYRLLIAAIQSAGATPVLMTNVAVFYDADLSVSWYKTNRNPTIDAYDDVARALATELSLDLIDVNAAFKADIALGNYDHRIRSDGTLDDSADGAHTGSPDFADYRTNIHYNDAGAQIVSDTIDAYRVAQSWTET